MFIGVEGRGTEGSGKVTRTGQRRIKEAVNDNIKVFAGSVEVNPRFNPSSECKRAQKSFWELFEKNECAY